MSKNIILCGVGGQGTVLASKLISYAAMAKGEAVRSAETIGMAQRGGSVTSHIRIGEGAFSPLIPKGKADVMITEITEAPYYVQTDARLAAPLLNTPFNHGEIGVLMRKGQDDLLQLVNDLIRQMKSDGSLRQLHERYGLVYGY